MPSVTVNPIVYVPDVVAVNVGFEELSFVNVDATAAAGVLATAHANVNPAAVAPIELPEPIRRKLSEPSSEAG